MDQLTRRGFVLAGLGAVMAGCAQQAGSVLGARPGTPWPAETLRPTPIYRAALPTAPPPSSPAVAKGGLSVIARANWAKAAPIKPRMNPMAGIQRITVHHEGWTTVDFSDANSTTQRLEAIRQSHLERMSAGDIGYHYIIDRAGRLWQGRDLAFQGAHVKDQNEHNIGVMVLGNFNEQSPTREQYASLQATLATLMREHRVPRNRVYTHQELGPTTCPGNRLQSHMIALRQTGLQSV